jgi:hypothetical protein
LKTTDIPRRLTAQDCSQCACSVGLAHAGGGHSHAAQQSDAVVSSADDNKVSSFDILAAHVHSNERSVTFHMTTAGKAGQDIPQSMGHFGGSAVWSYVWPTSLDPSAVGFEAETGILALAATSHPDFDDTPLFDENSDGHVDNDGSTWHSHWVVLTPNESCPSDALGVRNIKDGETPKMPATWPGVPIFLDSPGYTPIFDGPEIEINVTFLNADISTAIGASYDGVTSALRVNADLHAPLLCVENVFDVASGDLSLPGVIK